MPKGPTPFRRSQSRLGMINFTGAQQSRCILIFVISYVIFRDCIITRNHIQSADEPSGSRVRAPVPVRPRCACGVWRVACGERGSGRAGVWSLVLYVVYRRLAVARGDISGRRKAGGRGAVATLLIGVFFTCLRGILVILKTHSKLMPVRVDNPTACRGGGRMKSKSAHSSSL